jgi:hypothetical protein
MDEDFGKPQGSLMANSEASPYSQGSASDESYEPVAKQHCPSSSVLATKGVASWMNGLEFLQEAYASTDDDDDEDVDEGTKQARIIDALQLEWRRRQKG